MADSGPSRRGSAPAVVTLDVEIVRQGEAWTEARIGDDFLRGAAEAAMSAASLPPGTYQVAVLLTNDAEMRVLNKTWRGKDASTNVLSFPASEAVTEPGLLGDLVLAYETTQQEAREQKIALEDHVAHLLVHGMLHLLGFDHADDAEAEHMEGCERKVLGSLGIADPYRQWDDARADEVPS